MDSLSPLSLDPAAKARSVADDRRLYTAVGALLGAAGAVVLAAGGAVAAIVWAAGSGAAAAPRARDTDDRCERDRREDLVRRLDRMEDRLDAALTAPVRPPAPPPVVYPPPPPPAVLVPPSLPPAPVDLRVGAVWPDRVVKASSAYGEGTDGWSAAKALGAPDVWPRGDDDVNAWASAEADGTVETIDLGFSDPALRLEGVDVYETYNPGAVRRVELVGRGGETLVAYDGPAAALSEAAYVRALRFTCTPFAVASVRLTIDSAAVPGWNEIDAVGAHRCTAPPAATVDLFDVLGAR
ncbi:MAG TPA: hypothetical protein VG389_20455 [Myxococcota bacterium]|nr:hypothetical protein [Myxococcota bacterium]